MSIFLNGVEVICFDIHTYIILNAFCYCAEGTDLIGHDTRRSFTAGLEVRPLWPLARGPLERDPFRPGSRWAGRQAKPRSGLTAEGL